MEMPVFWIPGTDYSAIIVPKKDLAMGAIFENNLEMAYFIYGLAFFTMGIVIFTQIISKSRFKLADIMGFLGWFGVTHGINEWIDSLVIIRGRSDLLDIVRLFVLLVSFVFLFEFGRRIFRLEMQRYPAGLKMIAGSLTSITAPAIIIVISVIIALAHGSPKTGSVWVRHLLAFPGALLSGIGFFLYYKYEESVLAPFKVKKYFLGAGIPFLAYAILAGLIVNKNHGGALTWLSEEHFFSITSIPVQVFRAVCAVSIGWSTIGILGIFRLEIIKNLKELNERKTAFVANVSHELKNPLVIIKESLSNILDGISGTINPKQREVLEIGKKSVERLIRLVVDLLDLSKIEAGKMSLKLEQVDLKQVVSEVLKMYEREISKKELALKREAQGNVGLIWADRDKLTEVTINLLNNAIKYTLRGTITIKLAGDETKVRFEISDTGPGIPVEYQQKIFDKFERITAEKQEGTGLGLPVVRDIVELHKGKIWVESKAGSGSKFIFTLPRDSRK